MLTDFRYKDFAPSETIESEAQTLLEQVQKCLPLGTAILGSLEEVSGLYYCAVDAYVKRGSYYAEASSPDPVQAIREAKEKITRKILKVKDTRFYTRASPLDSEYITPSEYVN